MGATAAIRARGLEWGGPGPLLAPSVCQAQGYRDEKGSWPHKKDGVEKNHRPVPTHSDRPAQRNKSGGFTEEELLLGEGQGGTGQVVLPGEWQGQAVGGESRPQRHGGGKGWCVPGTTEHQPWPGRDGECLPGGLSQCFSFLMT